MYSRLHDSFAKVNLLDYNKKYISDLRRRSISTGYARQHRIASIDYAWTSRYLLDYIHFYYHFHRCDCTPISAQCTGESEEYARLELSNGSCQLWRSTNQSVFSSFAFIKNFSIFPVTTVLRKMKSQARESLTTRKPHLLQMLSDLGDFYLELKWDFHSWSESLLHIFFTFPFFSVPLLSKMLPSDLCKIYKRGTCLRLDTTLVDFNDRTWERGDISFIYDSSADDHSHNQLVILDNKAKVFQRVRHEVDLIFSEIIMRFLFLLQEAEAELDEEIDVLMSSDIVSAQMSTKPIMFQRAYSGWIFKREKSVK